MPKEDKEIPRLYDSYLTEAVVTFWRKNTPIGMGHVMNINNVRTVKDTMDWFYNNPHNKFPEGNDSETRIIIVMTYEIPCGGRNEKHTAA